MKNVVLMYKRYRLIDEIFLYDKDKNQYRLNIGKIVPFACIIFIVYVNRHVILLIISEKKTEREHYHHLWIVSVHNRSSISRVHISKRQWSVKYFSQYENLQSILLFSNIFTSTENLLELFKHKNIQRI